MAGSAASLPPEVASVEEGGVASAEEGEGPLERMALEVLEAVREPLEVEEPEPDEDHEALVEAEQVPDGLAEVVLDDGGVGELLQELLQEPEGWVVAEKEGVALQEAEGEAEKASLREPAEGAGCAEGGSVMSCLLSMPEGHTRVSRAVNSS
jgi:hypothetical protein